MALFLNDRTTNGNNLTNHGATEYIADFPFAAILEAISTVAASSQYLTAVNSSSLDITAEITIEAWLKPTSNPSVGNVMGIVSRYGGTDDTNDAYELRVVNSAGTLSLTFLIVKNTTVETRAVNYTPTTGAWHHYAFTWKGSTTTYELIVDGTSIGTSVSGGQTSMNTGTVGLEIATSRNHTQGFFDGKMADIRIYNVARTAAAVATDYTTLLKGNEANLVAWYPFMVGPGGLLMSDI